MNIAYSVALAMFYLGLAPVVGWQMLRRGKYRRGIGERLGAFPRWDGPAPLWLHAVSVGEAMAAAPLVRLLRTRRPDLPLLISTTTETGRAVAEQRLGADRYLFFPLDFGWAVRRALDRTRPRAVLLTETELWPNFLAACARRNIPVIVVNGRISPRSFPRYRLIRGWFGHVLKNVRLFCMQSDEDAERVKALGTPPERIRVTGNMKYDLPDQPVAVEEVRTSLGLEAAQRLLIAGSTHPSEEEAVLSAFQGIVPGRRLVLLIAPRHPERLDEVERMVRRAGLPCIRRTQAGLPCPDGGVLLLDTMGELSRLYAAAEIVFIGGSLIPHGGQNILEPAAYGRPVVHGPFMGNFAEIRERFAQAGAAREVADAAGLQQAFTELLNQPTLRERMGEAGRAIVLSQRGATARTADLVETLL